jgi:hypothetical protein
MREVAVKIYTFGELNEAAKERARAWWRQTSDLDWAEDSRDSIEAFLDKFGVKLLNYSIDFGSYHYRLSEYDNNIFRGMKLKDFVREDYPTGYCMDADISITFYDVFEKTGDAKYAFEQAVDAGFEAWRRDIEHQGTDEYIDECIICNEYEFDVKGNKW